MCSSDLEHLFQDDYINLESGYYNIIPEPILDHFIKHVKHVNIEGSYYMRYDLNKNKQRVTKERFKLQKIVDLKRSKVNGSVKLKLYKGNITIQSRVTNSSAYSMKKVSFEENKSFNKSNVERFINFHKKKLR